MQRLIIIIYITLSLGIFLSCDSSQQFNFLLQTEDGKHLKKDTKIFYLGIEVGQIDNIYFDKVNNKDFVFAKVHLTEPNILNTKSQISINAEGNLTIIQGEDGLLLNEMDTLKMNCSSSTNKTINSTPIKVTPINQNQMMDNIEVDKLTPEEKKRLDSLKLKIDKLNSLIKEVNDEN